MITEIHWPTLKGTSRARYESPRPTKADKVGPPLQAAIDPGLTLDADKHEAIHYLSQLSHDNSSVQTWRPTSRYPRPGEYRVNNSGAIPVVEYITSDGARCTTVTGARRSSQTDSWLQSKGVPDQDLDAYYFALGAQDVGASFFVTSRSSLLGTPDLRLRTNAVSPHEALSVIGLSMRLSGTILLGATPIFRDRVHTSWAPLIMCKRLLPEVWRLLERKSDWAPLLASASNRIESVLQLRDDILAESLPFLPSGRLRTFEAFEFMALMSDATLDSLARSINIALHLGLKPQDCGWRKRAFLSSLERAAPRLRATLARPQVAATISLLATLRNTVHSEPYGIATVQDGHAPYAVPALLLPPESTVDFEGIARSLGLQDHWRTAIQDMYLLDPTALANDITRLLVNTCDEIIASTPWPNPEVPSTTRISNPREPHTSIFSDFFQERIALLYGLN